MRCGRRRPQQAPRRRVCGLGGTGTAVRRPRRRRGSRPLWCPQPRVEAPRASRLLVVAFLDDSGRGQHDQPVHRGDRRQSMRDGDHRLAFHQPVQALLDRRLDSEFRAPRWPPSEQQIGASFQHHAGDRDALRWPPKASRRARDVRVVPAPPLRIDQRLHELVRLGAVAHAAIISASVRRASRRRCSRAPSGAAARCPAVTMPIGRAQAVLRRPRDVLAVRW